MKPIVPLLMYAAAYLLLFLTWAVVVFSATPNADGIVNYIRDALIGLTAHVMTLIQSTNHGHVSTRSTPTTTNLQAGRANPWLLLIIVAMSVFGLSACAGTSQVVSGYQSAVGKGLRAVEDNNIDVMVFSLCSTSIRAAVSHPELIPAIRSLCMSNGVALDPLAPAQGTVLK